MIDVLKALPDPDGKATSLLDSIDLIVPHQANKTMASQLAADAGLAADSLYFNIGQVGNASSASIPLAIHDAVRDGVINEPVRDSLQALGRAPWLGSASCASIRPWVAIAAPAAPKPSTASETPRPRPEQSTDDVRLAFG